MTTLPADFRRHAGNYCLPGTIKQGYLTKSPPLEKRSLMKNWKKRWCMLVTTSSCDVCLDYYHNEAETYSGLPIKRVYLTKCSKVEMDLEHSNYKHVFAIHLPQRVFYFAAPSDFEMREWADALCANLKLHKSSSSERNASYLSPPRYPQGLSPPVKERMAHSQDRPNSPQQLMNVAHYATPPLFHRTASPVSTSLPTELSQQTPPPLPPWNGTFTIQMQDKCPPPPPPPRSTTPTPSTSDDKSSSLKGTTAPPPPLRLPTSSPPESPQRSPTPPIPLRDEFPSPLSAQLITPPPPPPHHKRSIPSSPESLSTDPMVLSPSLLSMPPPLPPRREVLRQSGLTSVVNVNGTC